ncbi:LOW QUALITY PROTEIN: hypothetical protein T265_14357, partial [Opisthorchis viverrini]
CFHKSRLFTSSLKISRQPTTGTALHGAHQNISLTKLGDFAYLTSPKKGKPAGSCRKIFNNFISSALRMYIYRDISSMRLKHEAAWCTTFSCLETSQTSDSVGLQVSLSQNQIRLQTAQIPRTPSREEPKGEPRTLVNIESPGFKTGNSRAPFQLIRSAGGRRSAVSETIIKKRGSLIHSQKCPLKRWAYQFDEEQFSWPRATQLEKLCTNPFDQIRESASYMYVYLCDVLLIRLLKIRRHPTTGFSFLGANQAQSPGFCQPYVLLETKLHEISLVQRIQLPGNITKERFSWVLGLGNLAVSQPSCFLRVAWQLGTERVPQLTDLHLLPSLCNLS